MATFEDMLKELHNKAGASLVDTESLKAIKITAERQFVVPEGYNTVLAYEGDINSQIVTFELADTHEGHLLSACEFKKLRWSNSSAKTEGVSDLKLVNTQDDTMTLTWTVPPEAFIKAGELEISISFYDFDTNGFPAFAWNTPVFKGFSVGESTQSVGIDLRTPTTEAPTRKTPAKNEILFVDVENRNIVAPVGYNFVVGNYGDMGVSVVHFQMQRYVHGMDLLGNNTEVTVYGYCGEQDFSCAIVGVNRYAADGSYGEGLVNFDWEVPNALFENAEGYVGNFTIAILISQSDTSGAIVKRWNSSSFSSLVIGESDFVTSGTLPIAIRQYKIVGNNVGGHTSYNEVGGIVQIRDNIETPEIVPEKNELIARYEDGKFVGLKIGTDEGPVDAGVTEETLYPMLKNYLQSNQFIFNANLVSDIFFSFQVYTKNYPEVLYVSETSREEYGDPNTHVFYWDVYDADDSFDWNQEIDFTITSTKMLAPGKYRFTYDCNVKNFCPGSSTLRNSVSPGTVIDFTLESPEYFSLDDYQQPVSKFAGLEISLKLERLS